MASCHHNSFADVRHHAPSISLGAGAVSATSAPQREACVGVSLDKCPERCSGRGACNGADGLCECFEGFTDEDCSVQTVLV